MGEAADSRGAKCCRARPGQNGSDHSSPPLYHMQADFRGRNDTFYAVLSAPGMQFGARTTDTDFRVPTVQLVLGTFITDAVWVIRGLSKRVYAIVSSASKIGFDVFDANQPTTTVVAQRKGVWQTWKEDGILAFYKHQTFFVRANGWEARVAPAPPMAVPHVPLSPAPAPEHTRLSTRSLGCTSPGHSCPLCAPVGPLAHNRSAHLRAATAHFPTPLRVPRSHAHR